MHARHLFLLRHAEAVPGVPDARRELSDHGRNSLRALAAFLDGRVKLEVSAIWHSPLVRARQTAGIFQEAVLPDTPLAETPGLRPMDDPEEILARIAVESDSLLLVGHNPHFESLAARLLGLRAEGSQPPVNVPKASLLRFRHGGGSRWQLRDLITLKVAAARA